MTQDVARRYDAGENVSADVASTKYFASEALGRVADRAVQIHGGAGYMAGVQGGALLSRRAPDADLRGHQPDPALFRLARVRNDFQVLQSFECNE
jgi:alkylation response protein AidB-like acyl-CoA dehydrogenase